MSDPWSPPDHPATRYFCDGCTANCQTIRYHCEECENYDLCPTCFGGMDGRCSLGHDFFSRQTKSPLEVREEVLSHKAEGIGIMTLRTLAGWPDRPLVGSRPMEHQKHYEYIRAGDLLVRAVGLLRVLHDTLLEHVPCGRDDDEDPLLVSSHLDPSDREPIRVGLWSPNSVEWTMADVATALGGTVLVPLSVGITKEAAYHILSVTNARLLVIHSQMLTRAEHTLDPLRLPELAAIVVIGNEQGENDKVSLPWPIIAYEPRSSGPSSRTMSQRFLDGEDLINKIFSDEQERNVLVPTRDPSDVFTLIFTSGSTARPKGAIQTHALWSMQAVDSDLSRTDYIGVLYRSLAHSAERERFWRTLFRGGRCAILPRTDDAMYIFDELQTVNPTRFSAPPLVWNHLYDRFQCQFQQALKELPEDASVEEKELLRKTMMKKMSDNILGSRCQMVGCGSARVQTEVMDFLRECFTYGPGGISRSVYDGYGTTESGGITFDGEIFDSVQVRLVDVPELGFLTSSDPPRGEICVITDEGITGYWHDEEATQKLFFTDEDGVKWHRTGDIGELEDGHLRIIDRRSNMIKLSSGIFISLEAMESAFMHCPLVQNVFVHADPGWRFPLAVVTIRQNIIEQGEVVTSETILDELRKLASKDNNISPVEVPHGIIISEEPFTETNGCLTMSLKLCRPGLRKKFLPCLQDLYNQLTSKREESIDGSLRNKTSVLCSLYASVLEHTMVRPSDTASSLGADSMSIVALKQKIEESLGVSGVSIDLLWADRITDVSKALDELHGCPQVDSDSNDFRSKIVGEREAYNLLECLSRDICFRCFDATPLPPQESSRGEHLLLTGASGFIGGHVLAELLESQPELHVTCVVRAIDTPNAINHLQESFDKVVSCHQMSAKLAGRIKKGTVDVLACDLADDASEVKLSALRACVTQVIHAAADVNHVKPYSSLSASNVGGVRRLISVFGNAGLRSFVHVSSASVVPLTETRALGVESPALKSLGSEEAGKASGYALSKWAAERLIEAYIQEGALKNCHVVIARCGMACWSSNGRGNRRDWLTAMAVATNVLGYAPDGQRYLNLVPVDWTAGALVALARSSTLSRGLYRVHLVNPLPTDMSLVLTELADNRFLPESEWRRELQTAIDMGKISQRTAPAVMLLTHGKVPGGNPYSVLPLMHSKAVLPTHFDNDNILLCPETGSHKFIQWVKELIDISGSEVM